MDMFNDMTEFGENKGFAGQFTGFKAPGHAKYNGGSNNTGSSPG